MDNNGQQWITMVNNGQQSAVLHASLMPFLYNVYCIFISNLCHICNCILERPQVKLVVEGWRCSNIWMSNDVSIWIRAPVARSYSLWIYLFFPLPVNVFVFIHMNVFVSPCEYICVFAAGIPASLIHIPGSQPVVIPPSVDMSEFVDFSPLPRTHLPGRSAQIVIISHVGGVPQKC